MGTKHLTSFFQTIKILEIHPYIVRCQHTDQKNICKKYHSLTRHVHHSILRGSNNLGRNIRGNSVMTFRQYQAREGEREREREHFKHQEEKALEDVLHTAVAHSIASCCMSSVMSAFFMIAFLSKMPDFSTIFSAIVWIDLVLLQVVRPPRVPHRIKKTLQIHNPPCQAVLKPTAHKIHEIRRGDMTKCISTIL